MKLKLIFCCLCYFSALPLAEAYPWVFFRESKPKEQWHVELDGRASFFLNKKPTVFSVSGVNLEYHHPTIDINLGWSYSFLEKEHYFRLSELSLAFPFLSDKWTMNIGFRDVLWSEADRYWDYGLWQPRFLTDVFRPVQMGIPGIYLDYKEERSALLFLVSYFYLPDIVIYPQISNKTLFSKNPFFVDSMDSFEWNVDQIELFQIKKFFKPVVAFQAKHSIQILDVSFAYAYKPINRFKPSVMLKAPSLSIDGKEARGIRNFKYSLVPHQIAAIEMETVLYKGFSVYTSLLYDRPEEKEKDHETQWISYEFDSHWIFSLISFFQEKLDEDSQILFTVGWTTTLFEDNPYRRKRSDNIIVKKLLEGEGLNWKKAVGFSMEYQSESFLRGLVSRFRANYTLDSRFYVLAMEHYVKFTPHIQFYLSGDALFRPTKGSPPKNTSAIRKYSKLSRALIGAKYVF